MEDTVLHRLIGCATSILGFLNHGLTLCWPKVKEDGMSPQFEMASGLKARGRVQVLGLINS